MSPVEAAKLLEVAPDRTPEQIEAIVVREIKGNIFTLDLERTRAVAPEFRRHVGHRLGGVDVELGGRLRRHDQRTRRRRKPPARDESEDDDNDRDLGADRPRQLSSSRRVSLQDIRRQAAIAHRQREQNHQRRKLRFRIRALRWRFRFFVGPDAGLGGTLRVSTAAQFVALAAHIRIVRQAVGP